MLRINKEKNQFKISRHTHSLTRSHIYKENKIF
jgi:hypothetical protein